MLFTIVSIAIVVVGTLSLVLGYCNSKKLFLVIGWALYTIANILYTWEALQKDDINNAIFYSMLGLVDLYLCMQYYREY